MKLFWLFLFVLLPISVRGGDARSDQQKLKYLDPHETITLTPRQIEEVDTLGTLTLEPSQWRSLRAKGIHCPLRFDTVADIDCEALGLGADIGEFAVSLTPTTVVIYYDRPGQEEEGMRLLRQTVEDATAKEGGGILELQMDRRGQFYCRNFLVPFQTLLSALRDSKPVEDIGLSPGISVRIPLGLKRDSVVLKSRLDRLGEVAREAKWHASISDERLSSHNDDLTKH